MKIGDKFERWTVIGEKISINKRSYIKCVCACGVEKNVYCGSLKHGKSKSCGCLAAESCADVGRSNNKDCKWSHPLYNIFMHIKRRCENAKCHAYDRYGGRGIKCLFSDAKDFIDWAESNGYKKGLQVDRLDNDGHYSRDNCRLVTSQQNNNNKSSNIKITHNGETKTFAQWCRFLGVNYSTANSRRRRLGSHKAALGFE